MKVQLSKTNLGKTLIAAVYIGLSAVIGYLISASTGDPELFGAHTALINVLLVFINKTWLDDKTKNVG